MLAHGAVDWNHVVSGPDAAPVAVAFVAGLVFVIWIMASQWRRVRVAEAEAGLKIRLVERGYSADEMQRILESRPEPSKPRRRWFRKPRSRCTGDFLT